MLELIVVLAGIVVIVSMLWPHHPGANRKAARIQCISNLKNVGLSFRIFATDHDERLPMQLPVTQGGTLELVNDPTLVWIHFAALSNALSTPKVLLCPSDKSGREQSVTFDRSFRSSLHRPFSANANLSYFLGLDASETNASSILAGDRNITNDTTNPFRYGLARVGDLGTNHTAQSGAGWDENIHHHSGNVAMGDGSVQQLTSWRFQEVLRHSGDARNRIAVPD